MKLSIISKSLEDTLRIGELVGAQLRGGEVLELIGDIGSGKTAFVRGLANGAGSLDEVASPSFTLSKIYKCPKGLTINHFDFYRLNDPGIMLDETKEVIGAKDEVVVIEWADVVKGILPEQRLRLQILNTVEENSREFVFHFADETGYLVRDLKT